MCQTGPSDTMTNAADRQPVRSLLDRLRQKATGALEVTTSEGTVRVVLDAGGVYQVSGVPDLLSSLGRPMSQGPEDLLQAVGRAVAEGVPAQEALAAATQGLGRALGRASLTPALVVWSGGELPPPGAFALPDPILPLFVEGLREARPPREAARVWRARMGHTVRPGTSAPQEGLHAISRRALDLAARGLDLATLMGLLVGSDPSRKARAWASVDLLLLAGWLELVSPEEADLTDTGRFELEDLTRQLEAVRSATGLEVLGLDPRTHQGAITPEVVRGAFVKTAARYHPDRYTHRPPVVQRTAQEVFQALTRVRDEFTEPRRLIEEMVRVGRVDVEVDDESKAKAQVFYRKGLNFFRNRAWTEAHGAFKRSMELDPRPSLPRARLVFCQALLELATRLEVVEALDGIAGESTHPPNDLAEISWLQGWLLKLENDDAGAQARFRRAVELQPDHVEAARELRLAERRAPVPPEPPTDPGKPGGWRSLFSGRKGR